MRKTPQNCEYWKFGQKALIRGFQASFGTCSNRVQTKSCVWKEGKKRFFAITKKQDGEKLKKGHFEGD